MKFKLNINPNIVNSKGNVDMPASRFKNVCEDVAEEAHEIGLGQGFFYGALFATGVYIVTDVICALISNDEPKA